VVSLTCRANATISHMYPAYDIGVFTEAITIDKADTQVLSTSRGSCRPALSALGQTRLVSGDQFQEAAFLAVKKWEIRFAGCRDSRPLAQGKYTVLVRILCRMRGKRVVVGVLSPHPAFSQPVHHCRTMIRPVAS
jgi:hypothetical protein